MRPFFITLFTVVLATTIPSLTFGGMGYSTPQTAKSGVEPTGLHRENTAVNAAPHVVIAQQPYNLGQAIFSGTYKFGKASATHGAEKAHRLAILQTGLPASEQKKIDPHHLASHLTDREMNALEYYIQVRFEKFVTVAPSWARKEPPIKVTYSK